MATTTLKAIILGDNASAVAAFEGTALAADASATKSTTAMDGATSKIGGLFKSLGGTLEGVIGSDLGFSKLGQHFDEAETKGKSAFQGLAAVGGATVAGLAAGFAAVAYESLEMADAFDKAESQLNTAITNAGGSVEKLKPKVDDSYASMAKLGFNSTDTATALTTLTTATGSPTKAMGDLSTAADLARMKHISLSEAAQTLSKVYAGSTRALTQMGINLDIGSGKLASIQTASESLANAQTHLKQTQEEIAAGSLKGVSADIALQNAHTAVSQASEKLARDQGTIGQIMDTVQSKTKGAADAYGNTLAGQMDVAKATVHNLGTEFGEFLVPKIELVLKGVSSAVDWFTKHKAVAEALAGVIGGVLAIAIGAFAINMGVKMVKSIESAGKAIGKLGGKLVDMITGLGEAGAAEEEFGTISEETGEESSMAFGPIGLAIGIIIIVGLLLISHWKDVKKIASDVWNGVKDIFDDFMSFIKKWGPLIAEIILAPFTGGMSLILPEIIKHWGDIASFFEGIPGLIEGWFADAVTWLANAGGDIISGLWGAIQTGWTTVVNFFTGIGALITGWFKDAIGWLSQAGKDIISGLWTAIQLEYVIPATWLAGMAVRVAGYFKDALTWLLQAGKDIIGGMASGITAAFTLVAGWFGKVGDAITTAIGKTGRILYDVGKDVIQGFWDGMKAIWDKVTGWLGDIVSKIPGPIKSILGIGSPSKVFHEIGENIIQGLVNGISGGSDLVTNAITGVGTNIAGASLGMRSLTMPGAGASGTAATGADGSPIGAGSAGGKSAPVINISGVPITDATHIASEVGWALRTAA